MAQQQGCEISHLAKQHLECHPEDETHNMMSEKLQAPPWLKPQLQLQAPDCRAVRHYSL
jgi:hypothetical protein